MWVGGLAGEQVRGGVWAGGQAIRLVGTYVGRWVGRQAGQWARGQSCGWVGRREGRWADTCVVK